MKCFNCIFSIVTIQVIMYVRLLGGLYYKVSSNKLLQWFAKTYCVLCVAKFMYILWYTVFLHFMNADYGALLGTLLTIMLYLLNVVINFVYDGENFFNFRNEITKLDSILSPRFSEDIIVSKSLFIVVVVYNVISVAVICIANSVVFGSPRAIWFLASTALIQQTLALSNITKSMTFESVYHRMKLLRVHFEHDLSVARRFEDGENIMIQNLRRCMDIYKNLLASVHASNTPMKIMIFSTTAAVVPNSLILAYAVIHNTAFKYTKFSLGETIVALAVPFVPGIFVELINSEVDKIRLRVVKQLMVYRGTTARNVILDMVRYFEHRPFKYTVARIITVDLNLVLSMIGLVTTYTVAVIQFAHIYD